MKKTSLLLGLALLALNSCSDSKQTTDNAVTPPKVDSAAIKQATIQKNAEKYVEETKQEAEANLPTLLKEFNLKKDKVQDGGWYIHKKVKGKSVSHIEAPVAMNGYIYLKAHYAGEDWIFATEVIAKVGDKQYYSSKLKKGDDLLFENIADGKVFEILHLTSPKDDVSLIAAIALAPDNLEITIRFNGDQKFKDITLSKEDRKVLYDSWFLSQFISSKENGVELLTVTTNDKDEIFIAPKGNFPNGDFKLNN
jgi:hypothetical protein